MAATSSIELLNTTEWAKKMSFGRRSALGNFLEPAVTSANTVMQTILAPPFVWPWNRVVTGFVMIPGQQDYTLINWSAGRTVPVGWLTVDNFGNSQQVYAAGTLGTQMPTWNDSPGGQTFESGHGGTAAWINNGPIGSPVVQTSQSYNFGWIETSSVQDISVDPAKWYEMESKVCLGLDSAAGRPRYIAAQGNDGQGDITFRLMPVPDESYPAVITIQQKAPLFTKLSQTWSPIPDDYSHIYNWGFLSLMWLFADDARFGQANQKFVTQMLGSAQGLTETERNIWLGNWQFITGTPVGNTTGQAQGYQARGN